MIRRIATDANVITANPRAKRRIQIASHEDHGNAQIPGASEHAITIIGLTGRHQQTFGLARKKDIDLFRFLLRRFIGTGDIG